MLELLRLQDDNLTSEVMKYLIYGKPMPVDLMIRLNNLGIDPIKLQNQYDL